MKMNSLGALERICQLVGTEAAEAGALDAFQARRHEERIDGMTVGEAGSRSILCMRRFQKEGTLPGDLVDRIEAMRA